VFVNFANLLKYWVIERTHAWTNRCRRMAKEFDQRCDISEAWVFWRRLAESMPPGSTLLQREVRKHPLNERAGHSKVGVWVLG
jgi:hypothetical protein